MIVSEKTAKQLADELIRLYGRDVVVEAVDSTIKYTSWPIQYINRVTNKPYKPHNDAEAEAMAKDTPLVLLISGGWGCVAAETMVGGVPIAERERMGFLSMALGPAIASPAFRKGKADLYRVLTESGAEAVVTSRHRFLTHTGWRQLVHLAQGDVIAACDSQHVQPENERAGDYQGCYCDHSRQCDELPTPAELVVQDKWQQLHRIAYENSALLFPCLSPYNLDFRRLQPSGVMNAVQYLLPSSGGEYVHQEYQNHLQFACRFHLPYSEQQFRSLASRACLAESWEHLSRTRASGFELHTPLLCQAGLLPFWYYVFHSIYAGLLDGQLVYDARDYLTSGGYPCQSSSNNDSTFWTKIQTIKYEKFGDYYDLTVPFWNHYEGNGLLHHNSGKSTFGVNKTLDKVRKGMSGLIASNDLPQFRKSLWPEFQRWCPWEQTVENQQYRGNTEWRPLETFTLNFKNGAALECGGMDNPIAWLGPNINFTYVDEVSRKSDASCLQVCVSRARIPGPHGEPPQIIFTSTPALEEDWMYSYFGPLKCLCEGCGQELEIAIQEGVSLICPHCQGENLQLNDTWADFKFKTRLVRLKTRENLDAGNITQDYIDNCRMTLTDEEARVYLDAEFGHVRGGQPFLPSIQWWDDCRGEVPSLDKETPLVIAVDAASGRNVGDSDVFGIAAFSRHPDPQKRKSHVMVRYINGWQARPGDRIDPLGTEHNPGPERELLRLCGWSIDKDGALHNLHNGYNVKCIVVDPAQMNDMVQRFRRHRIAWIREFGQVAERVAADNDFLKLVQEKRIVHDGNQLLRRHISNADRKLDMESKKLRITKRHDSLKIDLAVCASMGSYEALRLQI